MQEILLLTPDLMLLLSSVLLDDCGIPGVMAWRHEVEVTALITLDSADHCRSINGRSWNLLGMMLLYAWQEVVSSPHEMFSCDRRRLSPLSTDVHIIPFLSKELLSRIFAA